MPTVAITIRRNSTKEKSPINRSPVNPITPGDRFHNLTVLGPTPSRRRGYIIWRCKCDCGREAMYSTLQLRTGSARNCRDDDCQYRIAERVERHREMYFDLTGQRFGKLVVVGIATTSAASISATASAVPTVDNYAVDDHTGASSIATVTGEATVDDHTATSQQFKKGRVGGIGDAGDAGDTGSSGDRKTSRLRGNSGVLVTGMYGHILWICHCDCGNTVLVPGNHLRSGQVKSCGCLVYLATDEAGNPVPRRNLVGQRFGMLTVVGFEGRSEKRIAQDGSPRSARNYWRCRCDCGNEVIVCQDNLRKGGSGGSGSSGGKRSHTTSCGCKMRAYRERGRQASPASINS